LKSRFKWNELMEPHSGTEPTELAYLEAIWKLNPQANLSDCAADKTNGVDRVSRAGTAGSLNPNPS
jgi:hypothetical protein